MSIENSGSNKSISFIDRRQGRVDRRQENLMSRDNTPSDTLSFTKKIVITGFVFVVLGVTVWSNEKLLQVFSPLLKQQHYSLEQSSSCQSLPVHGSVYVKEPAFMKRTDVLYAGLKIHNKHDYSMVVVLMDLTLSRQFMAASVDADKTAFLSVPVGQYGMQVFFGSRWCNLETGFSDGAGVLVEGGVAVRSGQTTLLEFYGANVDPVQLALAYRTSQPVNPDQIKPPSEVIGDGRLELLQSNAGHYFSSGSVNGAPVVFMIDTGATTVSISSEIAERAGISKCQPRVVSTANGSVNACFANVAEITFGKYRLTHVDVTIMPEMPGDALLGMNVLRHFRIEQLDKRMTISVH